MEVLYFYVVTSFSCPLSVFLPLLCSGRPYQNQDQLYSHLDYYLVFFMVSFSPLCELEFILELDIEFFPHSHRIAN